MPNSPSAAAWLRAARAAAWPVMIATYAIGAVCAFSDELLAAAVALALAIGCAMAISTLNRRLKAGTK